MSFATLDDNQTERSASVDLAGNYQESAQRTENQILPKVQNQLSTKEKIIIMMLNKIVALPITILLASSGGLPAFAHNTFQRTCSDIGFVNNNGQATLQASCLRINGTENPTSLVLQGIVNRDGTLVREPGASTFQRSCDDINILVDGLDVTISAQCTKINGSSNPTSLPLDGIENDDGNLIQYQ